MDLIDLSQHAEGPNDFVGQLHKICEHCDLDFASYACANPATGTVHAFTTYPDPWKQHYMENEFHRFDPTLHAAARSIAAVDWRRLEQDSKFHRVFGRAHDFGLPSTGLTIPVRGPYGETGLFSVTSFAKSETWDQKMRIIISKLQHAAVQVHDQVMHSESVITALRFPNLSGREREILQWVAAGKSQQVIGNILSISHRTVEVHLRSARMKLCTSTTPQAVGRAISLGLILPG